MSSQETYKASEESLKRFWLTKEEEEAWAYLQKRSKNKPHLPTTRKA